MHIRWYGQSAFLLGAERSVFIDPFGAVEGLAGRGLQFDYPPIEGVEPDLLLVTHEHDDHNAVEVIGGSPEILRSTAGTFESPVGEVVAVASEHDTAAGTKRGPNTIFRFALGGLRVCHFGDFGQAELRAEQQRAIGEVDVLLLPVGDGPTVGGEPAAAIVRALRPRLVVPMYCQTEAASASSTLRTPPGCALGAHVECIGESELEGGAIPRHRRPTDRIAHGPCFELADLGCVDYGCGLGSESSRRASTARVALTRYSSMLSSVKPATIAFVAGSTSA